MLNWDNFEPMLKPDCTTCEVENCFIKHCDSQWISTISYAKKTYVYKKKHLVIKEEDEVLGLYFIRKGKAKVYSTGTTGRQQTVRLTKQGDIIGHRGYGGESYPIGACALTDAEICFVDNQTIYEAFMHNPQLTFELMMYYSKELRSLEQKIKKMAQMSVKQKVIEALFYSKRIFSKNEEDRTIIDLGRQDLADIAGVNIEQLSRILSELKKENTISLANNKVYLLDEETLSALL